MAQALVLSLHQLVARRCHDHQQQRQQAGSLPAEPPLLQWTCPLCYMPSQPHPGWMLLL
jgi:hypothetical protein